MIRTSQFIPVRQWRCIPDPGVRSPARNSTGRSQSAVVNAQLGHGRHARPLGLWPRPHRRAHRADRGLGTHRRGGLCRGFGPFIAVDGCVSVSRWHGHRGRAGTGEPGRSLVGAAKLGATGATINPVVSTTNIGAGAYQSLGATPIVMEDVGPVGMPGMPLAGMAGMADDEFSAPVYGFRPHIMGRPPAAG
jgi:PPE-SVP subfamily C-terminal region